ncbi:hypothetical protein B0J14DRAFT_635830 [Halenospora varia]|nr:hypothetical protein B0J14DRAFT_635830 [Halenospora varia]
MSTAAEKANLARIRDNQRRSRARRKEYLQQLETRLRQCELQGIEASSEIQMAARNVVDENKKLRSLLAQYTVGDGSVKAYLQSSGMCDTLIGDQFGSSSGAVQILEHLLQTRKTCCGDDIAPMITGMGRGAASRDSSVSTKQSAWNLQTTNRRHPGVIKPTVKTSSSAQQFLTPRTSMASRTNSMSLSHSYDRGVSHRQSLALDKMPRYLSPASKPSNNNIFELDPQLPMPTISSYSNPPCPHTSQKQLQCQGTPQISSPYIPTTTTSTNVNSCISVLDMIPAMARADVECMSGMDYEVDNHPVFNVMDRYTGIIGI